MALVDITSILDQFQHWNYFPCFQKGVLVVDVPDKCHAIFLINHYAKQLARDAIRLGFDATVVRYQGCSDNKAYRISSKFAMRGNSNMPLQTRMQRTATERVFTKTVAWNPSLYDALGKMLEGTRPMALITSDDYQVWVNQIAADVIGCPPEVAINYRVSDWWLREDLIRLHEKIDTYKRGAFEHTYRAELTEDGQWARLTNRYEMLDTGHRLSTNLGYEFIEKPGEVMA